MSKFKLILKVKLKKKGLNQNLSIKSINWSLMQMTYIIYSDLNTFSNLTDTLNEYEYQCTENDKNAFRSFP